MRLRYVRFLLVVPVILAGAAVLLPLGWSYQLIRKFVARPFLKWIEYELGRV